MFSRNAALAFIALFFVVQSHAGTSNGQMVFTSSEGKTAVITIPSGPMSPDAIAKHVAAEARKQGFDADDASVAGANAAREAQSQQEVFESQEAAHSNASSGGGGGQSSGGCVFPEEAMVACEAKAKLANGSCATMSLMGMDPQTATMAEMWLSQMTMLVSQMKNSSGNAGEQCKKQADLSKVMGLLSAAKGTACGTTQNKCADACGEYAAQLDTFQRCVAPVPGNMYASELAYKDAIKKEKEAKKQVATCEGYKMNFAMMMMQTMQFGQNMLQNNQCASALASSAAPTPTPFAAATPIPLPTGGGDCSDPKVAAISMVCICQANPQDKMCSSLVGKPIDPNGTSGGVAGGAGTPGKPFSPDVPLGGTAQNMEPGQAQQASGNRGEEGGGGGGGFGSGGGGGGLLGGGGDGGIGGSGIDKNVITGQSSGGGGGGLMGGFGGGGGGGGGSRGGSYGGGGSGFNMKNFLPNKRDYKNRGLAGMTIPSVDGTTGPMGPSLFEKVTNQFQNQMRTFILDN